MKWFVITSIVFCAIIMTSEASAEMCTIAGYTVTCDNDKAEEHHEYWLVGKDKDSNYIKVCSYDEGADEYTKESEINYSILREVEAFGDSGDETIIIVRNVVNLGGGCYFDNFPEVNVEMDGEGGDDYIYGSDGVDDIYGGDGSDHIWGYGGSDLIDGEKSVDYLRGGSGNDVIYGGGGGDYIYGEENNDQLYGEGGNDYIDGGSGNDVLHFGTCSPGAGYEDILFGGTGDDELWGLMLFDSCDVFCDGFYGWDGCWCDYESNCDY